MQEGVKTQDFVKHSTNEFASGCNHINRIENVFASCCSSCNFARRNKGTLTVLSILKMSLT
ncbi:hypothetical protein [Campylobacter troglodytis]|uniref:hypothetical protein n=1 Tax=Campylobacter troglodytis TaxID=654363 RepID=UPI0011572A22|nr:hypothetical protein [Campylobacter troglodytis]